MGNQIHIGPAMQIMHPEYGDMTAEVASELQKLNENAAERAFIEADRRQRHIAKTCGQESFVQHGGMRLVAQIDESVFSYWEAREGRDFWKHELPFMLKRHPELAVKPINPNPTFGYTGQPRVRGKRGRWAA